MRLQDYDTNTKFLATVLGRERLTEAGAKNEVWELQVQVESQDFHAQVGQNIGVLAPGRREIGQDYHLRLYSIADIPQLSPDGYQQLTLCVRRCTYIDEFSGEEFPGVASNYLCDRATGDTLHITGPYDHAFALPPENHATLIMIGAGTGIAPFRAFIKFIYNERPEFDGRILLLHGGETGLDLLYRNEEKNDLSMYYDRGTFEAINALSKRPGWTATIDWGAAVRERAEEIESLLSDTRTYVYVAGLAPIRDELDEVLAEVVGSRQAWLRQKAELEADNRWNELLY